MLLEAEYTHALMDGNGIVEEVVMDDCIEIHTLTTFTGLRDTSTATPKVSLLRGFEWCTDALDALAEGVVLVSRLNVGISIPGK